MITALALLPPTSSEAQSVVWGRVSGTVVSTAGQPLPRVLVTVSGAGGQGALEATTDLSGRFSFGLLSPGTYELRAEAIGFEPVVARGLAVTGGESAALTLRLSQATPPVVRVDTIDVGASGSARWRAGGVVLTAPDLADVPDRYQDLASVTEQSSSWDRRQGALGLPSSMTTVVADGIPVTRAPHPLSRSDDLGGPLFPRSSLAAATVYEGPPDVEWSAPGGYVALSTPSGSQMGAASLAAAWSGDLLWSSGKLDFDAPSLTSFRGSASATVSLGERASLFVGGDGFREESPLVPRIDEALASSLAGLDPALIATLSEPGIDRAERYAFVARADVQQSATTRYFARGLLAYSLREFEGPGRVASTADGSSPEEGLDFSFGGGLVWTRRPGLDFEIRTGASRSVRDFEYAMNGIPSASIAGSATSLGVSVAGAGESSRSDFFVLPAVHYALGGGQLKVGGTFRASAHELENRLPLEIVYADAAAVLAGRGFAREHATPSASFDTREVGGFARYDVQATPELRVSLGARYEQERLPSGEVVQNADWLQASGLANDTFPSEVNEAGMVASLTWVPSPDGSTRFTSLVSLQHGDVDTRALAELVARDEGATSTRYAGTGLGLPGGTIPGSAAALPTLTLLGPDTRAPRTLLTTVGLARRVADTWTARIEGSYRRTDFLMRRRNLNLPAASAATDPNGREVFGTLQQDGSLVFTTADDARRFSAFHEVWALDPDGWSEYRGLTFGLDHAAPGRRLYASYTLSETTDNWIGASAGSPYAELSPLLPASAGDWAEGASDYDARHRVSAFGSIRLGPVTTSAAYRFRSGLPFTPGYRHGVDANGDGSFDNDVAFVDATQVAPILDRWACLDDQVGGFAVRNSCRGPSEHTLDVRIAVRVGAVGGREATLLVDALGLVESEDGVVDRALVLVDPSGTITTAPGSVAIPLVPNPDFGRVIYPSSLGRQLRIGFEIR